MDWRAGKSYYTAYNSIDRFDSIIFFYNYFCTWSIGIIFSLILPILFLFAPSSLHTNRTSHFFIICFICLTNMFCLYIQAYMLSGSGEPNLSFHTCRFLVYISTLAKPIELYLTLLFSIERILSKNLLNCISSTNNYRLYFKKFYLLLIFIGMSLIFSIRLYEILKFIKKNSSILNNNIISQDDQIDINNQTDKLNFQYCYRSLNVGIYAKILSFYTIQYWFEYGILIIISLILLSIIIYQYCLPFLQQHTLSRLSVNTKFYISLSSCVILFEFVLLGLHFIVTNENNNNTSTQVNYLQMMLVIYNIRCILLPFIICLTTCNPLKQWIYQLIILRPYLDNLNENDQSEVLSSSQQMIS
ncbi:unnamed protein product [Rotaria sordida]|uniref:Uncharacterized protein n=1 Tax=Rotaria sordida TaxID=392033 RepID=A0A813XTD3_9BILA|nr:unnamed protein product [Rotaria sordida]CAF0872726.1 unnamed protein product [Rotaria sordida]CAF3488968.1 unnamed protein product [Rotaria sordida]CAF3544857.1 unnamed protein product [Rotaria sordida]